MKKIVIILSLFLVPMSYANIETPILLDTSAITVDLEDENSGLINTQNLKRQPIVETQVIPESRKIKLDAKQIQHQRALDFMDTQGSKNMLPVL